MHDAQPIEQTIAAVTARLIDDEAATMAVACLALRDLDKAVKAGVSLPKIISANNNDAVLTKSAQ